MKNDFLIDREMQRERNFTGIAGTRHQDMAMSQSMGTISQRTCEHLGTSDKAIIAAHRRMVQMAKDLQEGDRALRGQPMGTSIESGVLITLCWRLISSNCWRPTESWPKCKYRKHGSFIRSYLHGGSRD